MKPLTTEHDFEPVPGLPGRLPPGEQLLWQGAPRWTSLAVHAYKVRAVAIYFAVLLGARAAWLAGEGAGAVEVLRGLVGPALFAGLALGILALVAWYAAKTTVYTVTNRRAVIRQGIALPTTVNLPYRGIEGASVKVRGDGSGDLALALAKDQRVSWAVMWPHVRPWRFGRPEPAFRCVAEIAVPAELLTRAYAATLRAGEASLAPPAARTPAPRPAATAAA